MGNICMNDLDTNQNDFTVLWLAAALENTSSIPVQQKKVRSVVKNLKKIETEEVCEEYIHNALLTEKIVLITSEALAKNVVPCVHQQCQLVTIFVYYDTEEIDTQWASKYKKVKFVKLDMLENHMRLFRCRWFRNSCRDFLPMNIFSMENVGIEFSSTDINGSFLFSQLLLDILLRIKSTSKDKDTFVHTYAKIYKGYTQQTKVLEDFNIHYREDNVFEWYTKDTFIFRLLNKALRIQNIDFLFLFRFFIRDLQKQLEKHRCLSLVHVYRGQLMSKSELSHLEQSVGQFISMNSFLSTSLTKPVALQFITVTDANINQAPHDLEYVLFEIDANPDLNGGVPAYANTVGFSEFDEDEILFTLGSVFRLNHVCRDPVNPYLSIVSMTLCGNDDHELKTVFDVMKKEYQGDETEATTDGEDPTLISLAVALLNMGHFNLAEKFLFRMLRTLRSNPISVDVATCYRYIGDVHRQKNNFKTSQRWYRKALQMYARVFYNDNALVATTYMNLGHAYSKTTDWKFSAWYQTDFANWWETHLSRRWQKSLIPYNTALDIYKRIYDEEHPCSHIAACYLSLGSAYLNSHQYLLAIENYQKALNIEEKLLPSLHPAFAYCHSKLALALFNTNQHDSATKHFEMALEIGLKSLPSGHPLIIELYYLLGNIYKNMGNIALSEEYFRKQFDLLDLPRTSVTIMVEVTEISNRKMHYLCPRCRLPVWVYPSCRIFKGKLCARCLRQILHLQRRVRVSPTEQNS